MSKRVALIVLTLGPTAPGCSTETKLTRVVVEVRSDIAQELASVRVQISDAEGTRESESQTFRITPVAGKDDDFLLSFAVAPPQGAASGAFIVRATGSNREGSDVVGRSEPGNFTPHAITRLVVRLDQACGLDLCDLSAATCAGGNRRTTDDAGCMTIDAAGPGAIRSGDAAGGDANTMGGSDSGSDGSAREPCSSEGALRCAGTVGARQKCSEGVWLDSEPCKTGEVCSAEQQSPGACLAVAEVCKGSGGQVVCDAEGVMYRCTAEGTVLSQEACATLSHCDSGRAAGRCAKCIPSEYSCTEKKLEQCAADGQGFTTLQECETAALCNKVSGDCTDITCEPGIFWCDGSVLRTCNANQDGWDEVMSCGTGLCDMGAGECDMCLPGTKTCEANTVVSCNALGQGYDRTPCSGTTNHCVGNGQCVECAADADCGDPGTCRVRHCNLGSGTCEPQFATERATCSGGLCSSQGQCLQCLAPGDCGTPATCDVNQCNSGTCVAINVEAGTSCTNAQGAGVCNDSGACVACNIDADCSGKVTGLDACHEAACVGNSCTPRIRAWVACDSGSVCDESGACKRACGNGHLDAGEQCDPMAVGWDKWTCNSQTCQKTGLNKNTSFRRTCTPDSSGSSTDCAAGETCKRSTWYSALFGDAANYCLPKCSNGVCGIPPGYTITTTASGDTMCDTSQDDCHVKCSLDSECPSALAGSCNTIQHICYGPAN